MSSVDDAFEESSAPIVSGDGLPQVMDLIGETMKRVQEGFVSYLTAGLIPMGVSLASIVGGIVVVYGAMFAGMVPGLQSNDEDLALLGGMGGLFVGIVVLMLGVTLVFAPMQASLYRAVWRHLTEDEPLGVHSAYDTFTQDLGRVVVYNLMMISAILVGMMFCYVPGFLVMMGLSFATPAIYIHRLSIGDAVRMSIGHVTEHFSWHVGFWALQFVMQMVLQYIPFLGMALIVTVVPLYVLLAYRQVFGEGEQPRGFAA